MEKKSKNYNNDSTHYFLVLLHSAAAKQTRQQIERVVFDLINQLTRKTGGWQ